MVDRRRFLWLAAAGLGVAGPALAAPAAPALERVRTSGGLRVGVKADARPFGFLDRGQLRGFEVDLARALARVLFDADGRASLVPVTTQSRLALLTGGQLDLVIATVTVTEERRQMVAFSDPYFVSGSLLVVRRDSRVKGLTDLAGRRLAVIGGSIQDRDVAELVPSADRLPVATIRDGQAAVLSGRAEAFTYDDVVAIEVASQHGDLRTAGKPFRPRPFAIAARKDDEDLVQWVNGWLAKLRRTGVYDQLWRTYFGEHETVLLRASG